jgi:hypothetical protein
MIKICRVLFIFLTFCFVLPDASLGVNYRAMGDYSGTGTTEPGSSALVQQQAQSQSQAADELSGIGAMALLILFAILYLFFKDLKRGVKLKAIKIILNLFALVLGPVAPWISGIYVVIRFLLMIIRALVSFAQSRQT